MKILIFEYSCLNTNNSLISEGFGMLKGLLNDLENISSIETYYLINEKNDVFSFENCSPIHLKNTLCDWLKENIEQFDCCLFIAPEDKLIQYQITKIVEKKVNLLNSNSSASFICSSKCLTYQKTPSTVLKIKTLKINPNNISFDEIKHVFVNYDFIVKPDNRTSSELIYHISSKEEFENILTVYKTNNVNEIILQEYIPGNPVSVSVICNDEYVNCISVNSQEIQTVKNKIEYVGCVTPIPHALKEELFSLSETIIKSIPGLKGFCGIDYIVLEDKIYFVEINSRITTPFIVLQKKCNENLTGSMINLLINNQNEKITFNGMGSFYKGE